MFNFLINKLTEKTQKEKVIDWLKGIAKKHNYLANEISLLIAYWNEPDFKFQKQVQMNTPTKFTEWIGQVSLDIHYETVAGLKNYTQTSSMQLMIDGLTPVATHYDFKYEYFGLICEHRITSDLDITPLLEAAKDNDVYMQKSATSIHFLTAIYAAKVARTEFLNKRREIKDGCKQN